MTEKYSAKKRQQRYQKYKEKEKIKAKLRQRQKRLQEIDKIATEWNNDLRKYLSRKIKTV